MRTFLRNAELRTVLLKSFLPNTEEEFRSQDFRSCRIENRIGSFSTVARFLAFALDSNREALFLLALKNSSAPELLTPHSYTHAP
jgi:hypothetical protein